MLKDKKVIIFDMDGTLIDSVGIWNQVDEALIQRIREDGKSEIKNVQRKRDEVLRKNDQANNPYIEYCTYLKKTYQSSMKPDKDKTQKLCLRQQTQECGVNILSGGNRQWKNHYMNSRVAHITRKVGILSQI